MLIVVVGEYTRRVRPAFRRAQASLAELDAVIQDNLSGVKEIQAFTPEDREAGRVLERARHYSAAIVHASRCPKGTTRRSASAG